MVFKDDRVARVNIWQEEEYGAVTYVNMYQITVAHDGLKSMWTLSMRASYTIYIYLLQ